MQKPLVSVVIPVYNGANYMQEAIESVIKQSYKHIEIIVVNDGSIDNGQTDKIALSFGDKIKYLKKENGGVSSALNMGIRQMQGEYFMWLSHDDIIYPDKIRYQIEQVQNAKVLISICSYEMFTDNGRKIPVPMLDFYDRQYIERGAFPVLNAIIEFGSVLLHKSIFEKYGIFREDLKTTQDYEFLFRILRKEKCIYSNICMCGVRSHLNQGRNLIASVGSDRDELYSLYLNELTRKEKIYLYNSEYNFYYQMLLKILPLPFMEKSWKICLDGLLNSEEKDHCTSSVRKETETVYIYGAGFYGKRLLFDLRCRGIETAGFIDKNDNLIGKKIDGILCYKITDIDIEECSCLIIVASVYREEIAKQLKLKKVNKYIFKEDIDKKTMFDPPNKLAVSNEIRIYKENNWIK